MPYPYKKPDLPESDLPKVERRHRYLISIFGPDKPHEVIMHTKEMYLTMHDLNIAKNWVLQNELPPETGIQSLSLASVSYLGYTSDTEFGVESNGEQVKE